MKHVLLALVAMFAITSASAQKLIEGSFAPLVGQTVINCVFDGTQAEAANMPLEDFIELKTTEDKNGEDFAPKYERTCKLCWQHFMEKANEKLKDVRFVKKPDAEYTMTIKLLSFDKPGRENVCDYIFTNTKTGEVVAVVKMDGKGGRFGSFNNLMNDAFKDGGEQFAGFFKKELKKAAKGK